MAVVSAISAIGGIIAFAGWVIGVCEFIGIWSIAEWAYRFGPVAARKEMSCEYPPGLATLGRRKTENIRYRVLGGECCLFRRRARAFSLQINTFLEVKGTAVWREGRLEIIGRYPLGPCLFFGAWLALWTVGGLAALVKQGVAALSFLLIGWLGAGGMFFFSMWLERRRFPRRSEEIADALTNGKP